MSHIRERQIPMRRPTNVGDPSFAEADRDYDLTDIHDRVAGLNTGLKKQKELNHRVSPSTKELLMDQVEIVFESMIHQAAKRREIDF